MNLSIRHSPDGGGGGGGRSAKAAPVTPADVEAACTALESFGNGADYASKLEAVFPALGTRRSVCVTPDLLNDSIIKIAQTLRRADTLGDPTLERRSRQAERTLTLAGAFARDIVERGLALEFVIATAAGSGPRVRNLDRALLPGQSQESDTDKVVKDRLLAGAHRNPDVLAEQIRLLTEHCRVERKYAALKDSPFSDEQLGKASDYLAVLATATTTENLVREIEALSLADTLSVYREPDLDLAGLAKQMNQGDLRTKSLEKRYDAYIGMLAVVEPLVAEAERFARENPRRATDLELGEGIAAARGWLGTLEVSRDKARAGIDQERGITYTKKPSGARHRELPTEEELVDRYKAEDQGRGRGLLYSLYQLVGVGFGSFAGASLAGLAVRFPILDSVIPSMDTLAVKYFGLGSVADKLVQWFQNGPGLMGAAAVGLWLVTWGLSWGRNAFKNDILADIFDKTYAIRQAIRQERGIFEKAAAVVISWGHRINQGEVAGKLYEGIRESVKQVGFDPDGKQSESQQYDATAVAAAEQDFLATIEELPHISVYKFPLTPLPIIGFFSGKRYNTAKYDISKTFFAGLAEFLYQAAYALRNETQIPESDRSKWAYYLADNIKGLLEHGGDQQVDFPELLYRFEHRYRAALEDYSRLAGTVCTVGALGAAIMSVF